MSLIRWVLFSLLYLQYELVLIILFSLLLYSYYSKHKLKKLGSQKPWYYVKILHLLHLYVLL